MFPGDVAAAAGGPWTMDYILKTTGLQKLPRSVRGREPMVPQHRN